MLLRRSRLILIKICYLHRVFLLDHPSLKFHTRRQFSGFDGPLIRDDAKPLDVFEVSQGYVHLRHNPLVKRHHLRIVYQDLVIGRGDTMTLRPGG